jgi:hypothetical protein
VCPIADKKTQNGYAVNLRIIRIPRFLKALTKFIIEGRGKFLSEEKILARFEICKICPHFTGRGCKKCGCNCNNRKTYFNKLAMPTEECPEQRWKREI